MSRGPTVVFGYAPAIVSFDHEVGYGGKDGRIRLKVVVLEEKTNALVSLSITDVFSRPPKYRWVDIPLEKCSVIGKDHGRLYDEDAKLATGVAYYRDELGFDLPAPSFDRNYLPGRRGSRSFYGHRAKQYHFLDLRIECVPELEWQGTPLEEMPSDCQAIIADFEENRALDLLVMAEFQRKMPGLEVLIELCDKIEEDNDRVLAMQAQATTTTSTADQDEIPDEDMISISDDDTAAEHIPEGEQAIERSRKFKGNLATMLVDGTEVVKQLLTSDTDMVITEEMANASVKAV